MSLDSRIGKIERAFKEAQSDESIFFVVVSLSMKLPSPGQMKNCPYKDYNSGKNMYSISCFNHCDDKCELPADNNGQIKNLMIIRIPHKAGDWEMLQKDKYEKH